MRATPFWGFFCAPPCIAGQRSGKKSAAAQVDACSRYGARIKSGERRPKKIFFTDKKISRLGQMEKMSGQNHRVYVEKSRKRTPPQSPLARLYLQEGIPGTVAPGVGYTGLEGQHMVERKVEMSGQVYLDMLKNVYHVDCREPYGGTTSSKKITLPPPPKRMKKSGWAPGLHVGLT